MSLPDTTVIGTGRLGSALVRAFYDKDISIKSVFNRTVEKARGLSNKFEISIVSTFPSSVNELGKLVFLTVADQAIEDTAQQLAELGSDFSNHIIVHCSGNQSAEVLKPLKEKGAVIASFHPLQTFTGESAEGRLEGISFSLQGDNDAFNALKDVAQKLDAETLEVTPQQKSDLHAAAVLASNYLTALLDASVQTASLSGLSKIQAKKALMPLIQTAVQNIDEGSFEGALTGPIQRGDIGTVKQHLELLEGHSELVDLYITMGKRTVNLAERSGSLKETKANKLRKMFNNYG
ncbi:putative oxidoreductase, contains short-chain dehydrogenase (SDR) and DUF2520 domains [Fodinibius salinus]|uniref:Putative oxidoreductase, contains short-chain dehydrogenase (SDR) and DUF2520 domains n=1 Tax=Fodinibius salinus TaxID=860790 RepID=A0A5D3YNC7_9BACT|nr:Rossmann-like and DUF2520 domain-containing protein [Fodinibius salinus]TYP95374.1 putative oxidoreductase, contains short-chain dehydrogenase (SDR) and DUF2520 domains [Fodinibius salinus]